VLTATSLQSGFLLVQGRTIITDGRTTCGPYATVLAMIWDSLFRKRRKTEDGLAQSISSFLQDAAERRHWIPVLYQLGPEREVTNLAPLITYAFEVDCDLQLDIIKMRLTKDGQEWLEEQRLEFRDRLVRACWDIANKENLSIQDLPKIPASVAKVFWETLQSCP